MSIISIIVIAVAVVTAVLAVVTLVHGQSLRHRIAELGRFNADLIKEVEVLNQLLSIRESLVDQLQQDAETATLSQVRLSAQLLDLAASHQALWSKHLDTVDELLALQERYEPHNLPLVDTPDIPGRHLRLVQNPDVSLS